MNLLLKITRFVNCYLQIMYRDKDIQSDLKSRGPFIDMNCCVSHKKFVYSGNIF